MILQLVISIILGILLALVFLRIKIHRLVEMSKNFPGPKPLPLIGNVLEFGSNTKEMFDNSNRLEKEYGTFFRFWIGPNLSLSVTDPRYIEIILSSSRILEKAWSYKLLHSWLGDGLLIGEGQKWKSHRKLITPTFHVKILEEFIEVFNSNINILINKLKDHVNGDEFDIYPYIKLYALDNICETAMGVAVNGQKDSESEYVKAIATLCDLIMYRAFRPWYQPDCIFNLSPLGRVQKKCLSILHNTTKNVVGTKKKELLEKTSVDDIDDTGGKKKVAFLDLLLQSSVDNSGVLTDKDIQEEVDTLMFAGHDTSTSAISFSCWALGNYPDIQEKLVAELKSIFGDSDRMPTCQDLQELKYMEMFIKESLRLYPSVPLYGRKLSEDLSLGDYKVPAGTNVFISAFMTHRNPEYFLKPEKFDPDRFLPENSLYRHPYCYIPFAAGPRNCVGQKFAMLEIKATLCQLLRTFKFIPCETPLCLTNEIVLKSLTGINVKLQHR